MRRVFVSIENAPITTLGTLGQLISLERRYRANFSTLSIPFGGGYRDSSAHFCRHLTVSSAT